MTEQILIVLVYSLTIVAKKTGDSLLRFILHHDHKLALDLSAILESEDNSGSRVGRSFFFLSLGLVSPISKALDILTIPSRERRYFKIYSNILTFVPTAFFSDQYRIYGRTIPLPTFAPKKISLNPTIRKRKEKAKIHINK